MQRKFSSQGDMLNLENYIAAYLFEFQDKISSKATKYAVLNNLGIKLRKIYSSTGNEHALNLAIKNYEESLSLVSRIGKNRPIILNNLANSLRERYHISESEDDLEQALSSFKEAAKKTSEKSSERIALLTNYGHCLRERFSLSGNEDDLDTAIGLYREAAELSKKNTKDRVSIKNSLSDAYLDSVVKSLAKAKEATYSSLEFDYITFINDELTPNFLQLHVVPIINAIGEIQEIINAVVENNNDYVLIKSITQNSPISIGLEGATDTIKLIQETITPWRKKHIETMSRLLEQEKLAEIESKKAEVLEKRARAAKERAEAGKITAEVSKQREEAVRMNLENEKIKLELYRAKVELALGILKKISPNLPEADKLIYLSKLLPSLDILINVDLDVTIS